MTQTQFFSRLGPPVSSPPEPSNGIVYANGSCAYHGRTSSGFVHISGDFACNGQFSYTGLIYVEGDGKINGGSGILGSLVVKRTADTTLANGNAGVSSSSEALTQAIGTAAGNFVRLSWREIP